MACHDFSMKPLLLMPHIETRGLKINRKVNKEIDARSDQFLLTLCCNELFYHDFKLVDIMPALHESDSLFLISSVLKLHVILMLSCHCNMTKAFSRVAHVALR